MIHPTPDLDPELQHDAPVMGDAPDPSDAPDPATLCALNSALLRQVGARLGFEEDLTPEVVARFERYAAELVVWNQRVNLTRITRPDEIAIQHFLDSLICLRGLPEGSAASLRCIDVGTGAGLPGLPLGIVRPDWRLTLVDSVGKKTAFLSHVVEVLAMPGVTVLHARAEDVGRMPAHRATYDLAVARAVVALPVLVEFLLPLLKVHGRMLVLKGSEIDAEVAAMRPALGMLGGRLVEVQPYTLPGVEHTRHLVVIEKLRSTRAAYPRRAGEPGRRPLR
jgi:16S rRNA (guanine527-N7)-methyltransferase